MTESSQALPTVAPASSGSDRPGALSPPGPGVWRLDVTHFPRPLPRFGRDEYARAFELGVERGMAGAGLPLRTVALRFVEGLAYTQPIPLVGGPPDDERAARSGPPRRPPWWVARAAWAIVPTLRKRSGVAKRYFESRGWRRDVTWWDEEAKPALRRRLDPLAAARPRALSDEALLAHVTECLAALEANLVAHFTMNPAVGIPVGRFLAHARRCTDLDDLALLALTSRWRPALGSEPLTRLVDALRAAGLDDWLVSSEAAAPDLLAELQGRTEAGVGELARAWMETMEVRQIATGDMTMPNAGELPQLLRERLRQALTAAAPETAGGEPELEEARARVPQPQRGEFDALLEEARHVYRIRDERSAVMDSLAFGVCRRGALELGRRLVERERLRDAEHAIELDAAELAGLLQGATGPTPEEAARRAEHTTRFPTASAPALLGGEAGERPGLEFFPGPIAAMLEGLFAYDDLMFSHTAPGDGGDPRVVTGTAASQGKVRGVARRVERAADFGAIRPGDVLVARTTMPAYDGALSLVSAIVTDYGGALSHAAIVAREYGIPAVVNTRVATSRIPDGAVVEVDGDRGEVRVIE